MMTVAASVRVGVRRGEGGRLCCFIILPPPPLPLPAPKNRRRREESSSFYHFSTLLESSKVPMSSSKVPGVFHLGIIRALELVLVLGKEIHQKRHVEYKRRIPHVVRSVAQPRGLLRFFVCRATRLRGGGETPTKLKGGCVLNSRDLVVVVSCASGEQRPPRAPSQSKEA
jgi:hypothetical protein